MSIPARIGGDLDVALAQLIKLYEWIAGEFTVPARQARVAQLAPHLGRLFRSGDRVLDLCCGTGPFSFWLEEQGAQVTAIDVAPHMIDAARSEASRRKSSIRFLLGDIREHDFGGGRFDLIILCGNTITDFPFADLSALGRRAHQALQRGGRFAVHFDDGLYQFVQGGYAREAIQRDEGVLITRKFGQYLPDDCAFTEIYTNHTTGEECEYTSHIYTPRLLALALNETFERESHTSLGESSFLDAFRPVAQF